MASCCEPRGYERVFSERQAERDAGRYRRRGLTWGPRRTVELYRAGQLEGRTLLEVGGGVGDLQIELLRAGVAHATSVELSPAYEATAARLLDEAGLADRCTRVVGAVVATPDLAAPADLVVLHSVVCCYPDAVELLTASASRALHQLVVSYPRETWWLRAWAPLQNLYPALRGSDLRFVVHPPGVIHEALARCGFALSHDERNRIDHLAVFTRR